MSDFKFSCTACGQKISADTNRQGAHIYCPACNASLIVPKPPDAPVTPSAPQPPMVTSHNPLHDPAFAPNVVRTSALAVASLLCSLFSLFTCIGWLPGIICGHMARRAIRQDPSLKGDGMAKAGLIIGYIGMICCFAAIAVMISGFASGFKQAYEQAKLEARAGSATNSASDDSEPAMTNDVSQSGTRGKARKVVQYDKPAWTLDLKNATFPDHPVSGLILKNDVSGAKTGLPKGELKLDFGNGLQVFIHGLGTSIEGKSYETQPLSVNPDIQIRVISSENGHPLTQTYVGDFALKLNFEKAMKRKVRGQIYLCLPDDSKSVIAGSFTVTLPKKK